MEHIPGGELFDHVVDRGHLSEHEAARVIRQVASALAYCHQHGVVHRAVAGRIFIGTSGNIWLEPPDTWLVDITSHLNFVQQGALLKFTFLDCFR